MKSCLKFFASVLLKLLFVGCPARIDLLSNKKLENNVDLAY